MFVKVLKRLAFCFLLVSLFNPVSVIAEKRISVKGREQRIEEYQSRFACYYSKKEKKSFFGQLTRDGTTWYQIDPEALKDRKRAFKKKLQKLSLRLQRLEVRKLGLLAKNLVTEAALTVVSVRIEKTEQRFQKLLSRLRYIRECVRKCAQFGPKKKTPKPKPSPKGKKTPTPTPSSTPPSIATATPTPTSTVPKSSTTPTSTPIATATPTPTSIPATPVSTATPSGSPPPAVTCNLFVSTNGNDSNPGTSSSPFRTVQRGVDLAQAGDTVCVKGGVYNARVQSKRDGSASARITIASAPGETATIDGTGLTFGIYSGLISIQHSHHRIIGFEIINSTGYGIGIGGNGTHLHILSNHIHDNNVTSAIFASISDRVTDFLIQGNKVEDNGRGITLWNANGAVIDNNEVLRNTKQSSGNYDGIQFGGQNAAASRVIVSNNTVKFNGKPGGSDEIDGCGGNQTLICEKILIENNTIEGDVGSVKIMNEHPAGEYFILRKNSMTGVGIVVYQYPTRIFVYNNTIVDSGHAFFLWDNPNNGPAPRSLGGAVFKNNAGIGSTSYMLLSVGEIDLTPQSVDLNYNVYKFTDRGIGWGSNVFNTQLADPQGQAAFVAYQNTGQDPSSKRTTLPYTSIFEDYNYNDYRPRAGSPLIDAGGDLTFAVGSGSGNVITVDEARYFMDGWGLVQGDKIVVGSNGAVGITAIDYQSNSITLDSSISWNNLDSVNLDGFTVGAGPDAGAFEYGQP
ncbi:DUF1565 domain-containing protein [Oligoflexia bacterium]|nr:DUF1565 domain-containing protein [Oligoflexia bacterium]